ncbi:class I SAM-dependent methyltransferase [uncultured Clostridium sp.]|uniref:class I SAM-dependent DNA methyltransferase n=1 Tax=uncultured Clostridium sp. TaxID=59620 RepID=UPI0028F13E2C|nr:class I SAM-dependent methyltransferase [uncultured Clostridium sp.]
MTCYNNFADIYDNLIKEDVDYLKWSRIILEYCNEYKVELKDYLDLACGTGNITELIGSDFSNVWGVDLSPDMLSECEIKLREKNIHGNLICQDITALNLQHKKFDLITCCLDSVNYILEYDGLINFFDNVYQHLKEGGLFIFDVNSYYKLSNILGNNTYTYDEEGIFYVWENTFEEEIVDMYLTFFLKKGDMYDRFDEIHRERAYKKEEIEETIKNAGFKILHILDNYEKETIKNTTERIAYILTK